MVVSGGEWWAVRVRVGCAREALAFCSFWIPSSCCSYSCSDSRFDSAALDAFSRRRAARASVSIFWYCSTVSSCRRSFACSARLDSVARRATRWLRPSASTAAAEARSESAWRKGSEAASSAALSSDNRASFRCRWEGGGWG